MSPRAEALHEYRTLREAQDRRFESATRGGVSVCDTASDEYGAYFGVGQWAGSGTEERWTFKRFLIQRSKGEAVNECVEDRPVNNAIDVASVPVEWWVTPGSAFFLLRSDLVALAASGDGNAVGELARRDVKRRGRRAGRVGTSVAA